MMVIPAIIQALADRVDTYVALGRETVVTLHDSPMRSLNIRLAGAPGFMGVIEFQGYLNLLDFTDIWVKAVSAALTDNEFDFSRVFLRVMGLETTLQWRGLIRRTPTFITNPRIQELTKHLAALQINTQLTDELNRDTELMHRINTLKPRRIDAKLMGFLSYVPHPTPRRQTDDLEALRRYAQNPDKIIWEISLLIPLLTKDGALDIAKTRSALDVMNSLADKLIHVTRHLILSL